MIKKFLLFLTLSLILIFTAILIFLNNSLAGRLLLWKISLDLSGFELKSFSKDKTRFSEVERLEVVNDTIRVFIDRIKISDHFSR